MSPDLEEEILQEALFYFGINHQSTKAIEEMSELTKELCKHKDCADNMEEIAEEIADVYITLDQLVLYYGIENRVAQVREAKLRRLNSLIFEQKYALSENKTNYEGEEK